MNFLCLLFLKFCISAEVNLSKKYIYMKYENENYIKKKNDFYEKYIEHVLDNLKIITNLLEILDYEEFVNLQTHNDMYKDLDNLTEEVLNKNLHSSFLCLKKEINQLKKKILKKCSENGDQKSFSQNFLVNIDDVTIFTENFTEFMKNSSLQFFLNLENKETHKKFDEFIEKDLNKDAGDNSTFYKEYNLNKKEFLEKNTKKTKLDICKFTDLNTLKKLILQANKKERSDTNTKLVIIFDLDIYISFFNLFVNLDDKNYFHTPQTFNEDLEKLTETIQNNVSSKQFKISKFKSFLATMNVELYFECINDEKTYEILNFTIDNIFNSDKTFLKSIVEVHEEINKQIRVYCDKIGQTIFHKESRTEISTMNVLVGFLNSLHEDIQKVTNKENKNSFNSYADLETEDQDSDEHTSEYIYQDINYASPNDDPSTSTKRFPFKSTPKRKTKCDTDLKNTGIYIFDGKKFKKFKKK